ncbi:hypothetical protein BDR05DRAFT_1000413 [Suillus weaverae]|nr:hypothetical protein BDR05DRAFT_1000413 [Suillus weaverae]
MDNQDSVSDDSETKSESKEEDNGGNCDNGDNTEMKTEDVEMKTEDAEVGVGDLKVEDEDLTISPEFEPVVASPCNLLTRQVGNPNPDPENPTAPWSYYIKKRTEVLEN